MNAILIALITFVSTFGWAWLAIEIRSMLPPSAMAKESQDVVRLGMGLVATMTALLLGLVTAAAKSSFDSQDAALRASAVSILTLDSHLARYGPETQPIRALVGTALASRIEATWPQTGTTSVAAQTPADSIPASEQALIMILALKPTNDTQQWLKSEALKLTDDVVKTRWRILSRGSGAVPRAFLIVVIFWLSATFTSFGLYAPRNVTVLGVLFVAAVSVAAAVFLIMELDGPYTGLIRVSADPLRYALEHIGR